MSARKGTFSSLNVFLSRNLVPPEVFDALHDALRLNGAQVFLCCDPSRNTPNDYHIISSPDHDKFEDLRAKGCNLVGPHCVLSCAKEHRMLPKQGYTCCLAMDGVKVLASGFERDEKAMIEKRVTAMGGVLQAKPSMDVNFVIVRNVLSAKYKWALNILKKPIVNMNWLCQCWTEHRVMPQEPYRVLPFMGLTICVTRMPTDERKEIEKVIIHNGGQYSPELTRKCTHLVSDAPTGDKYVVARRWGHIHIVNRKWIDQCISRRACMDERLYPLDISASCNVTKVLHKEQYFQEPSNVTSQLTPPTIIKDLGAVSSQHIFISDSHTIKSEATEGYPAKMEDKVTEKKSEQIDGTTKFDFRVAQDSEEDNDLYLSSCIICLVGFEEKVLRKLVSMIRRGGGTRHILLSEKLTHIILGSPSDAEKKDVRHLAACGVINVVDSTWLEESDQAKRELPVSSRHHSGAFMIPKGSPSSCMETSVAFHGVKKFNSIYVASYVSNSHVTSTSKLLSDEKRKINGSCATVNELKVVARCESSHEQSTVGSNQTGERKLQSSFYFLNGKETFKGKTFCFSSTFPIEPRAEVIEWIKGGGGIMLDDQAKTANFIIECHGLPQVLPSSTSQSTAVSTHWIRSSLEVGCMQDVSSHILYSPLHCHIPLLGFKGLRFCISQYEEKERTLLKNVCFVLGSKFTEKLTNKVTHLLCKFTNGPKYESARRKGIHIITAEWIIECISHDKLVPTNSFQPRPVTLQDKLDGLCTVSQHPTQAVDMISLPSQSQSQLQRQTQNTRMNFDYTTVSNRSKSSEDSTPDRKRSKLSECDEIIDASKRNEELEVREEDQKSVSDVIDAIDDLLAQSGKSKIQDLKLPVMPKSERSIFVSEHANISQRHGNSHTAYGIPSHLSIQPEKQESTSHTPNRQRSSAPYDAFSETQTESQVVGYEEDLSGRQKIIERVRSQSLTLTPDIK